MRSRQHARGSGIKASAWGWIALAATVVSAFGYALQTVLDYVPEPAVVGEVVFYGVFVGDAVAGLLTGAIAVATGLRRGDSTLRLGLVAIAYVALAQLLQSVWD